MTWVGRTWWQIYLADGWVAQDDPECLTLTHTDDGAFQLSSAVKSSGPILMTELEEFCLDESPSGAKPIQAQLSTFSGLSVVYAEDGAEWHKFWVANGNLMIYATYNGTPSAWT